jgi:hypothetical protein
VSAVQGSAEGRRRNNNKQPVLLTIWERTRGRGFPGRERRQASLESLAQVQLQLQLEINRASAGQAFCNRISWTATKPIVR